MSSIATEKVVTVTLMGPRAFPHVRNTDFAVYHVFLSGPVNADVRGGRNHLCTGQLAGVMAVSIAAIPAARRATM